MSPISISTELGLGLESLTNPTVVCDEQGRVLGHFVPLSRPVVKPEDNCPYTPEELEQLYSDTVAHPERCKSLAEFWKEMGRSE